MARQPEGGIIRRTWRRLTRPSTHWSVLALLVIGIVVGLVPATHPVPSPV